MRFVEDTEGTWTAIQLKAVEAEIEQQKRDWEANRLAQLKREEEAARQLEAEENDLLTFSREDASNQVNKSSSNRSSSGGKVNNNNVTSKDGKKLIHRRVAIVKNAHKGMLGKRKGSISGEEGKDINRARCRATMAALASRKAKKMKLVRQSESSATNTTIRTRRDSVRNIARPNNSRRKRLKRSPSKRITRSSESKEDQENKDGTDKSEEVKDVRPTDEFDSECSLDVMIDSNDAPDSDSNQMNNYYSSVDDESGSQSQDDGNQRPMDESKQTEAGAGDGVNSTPRTRSRGSVKINLWTLDDSPILAVKRPRTGDSLRSKKNVSGDNKSDIQSHDESSAVEESTSMINNDTSIANESSIATELSTTNPINTDELVVDPEVSETIKELKILVTDVKQVKRAKVLDGFASPQRTPSPKARKLKKFPPKSSNNRTLDSWVSKTPKSAVNNSDHSDSVANDKSITPVHSGRTTRASLKLDVAATHENGES